MEKMEMMDAPMVCPWNNWEACFGNRCPYYKCTEALDSIFLGKCFRVGLVDDGK